MPDQVEPSVGQVGELGVDAAVAARVITVAGQCGPGVQAQLDGLREGQRGGVVVADDLAE
ncbi:hypothetical protein ACNTMW_31005 [Planosporangium sp. 12N6]|uniref:hypothetical protein n=1 Tax=Planosporangium spinosum TaxID=3402278 RepID=UPI003CE8765E